MELGQVLRKICLSLEILALDISESAENPKKLCHPKNLTINKKL